MFNHFIILINIIFILIYFSRSKIFYQNQRTFLLMLKQSTLMLSVFFFFLMCLFLIFYDPFYFNNMYLFKFNLFNLNFFFGIDGISIFFIFLTTFIVPNCVLYSCLKT